MVSIFYKTTKTKQLAVLKKARAGVWVHIENPNFDELENISKEFGIDFDTLKDAVDIYEAPRVESENGVLYIFTRFAYPDNKDIATEPLMIAIKDDCVITVMRDQTNILNKMIDGRKDVVTTMKSKLVLQILAEVNFTFQTKLNAIGKQILSIRASLKKDDIDNDIFVSFIDLEEDLSEFLSALLPQKTLLNNLTSGKTMPLFEDDRDLLEDLELNTSELIEITKSRLKTIQNTREAYATIMANTLNKTFKRLTSISIFMTVPAITAALYGMNLALPLQGNRYAFWEVLAIVMLLTGATVWIFQRKKWL